MFVVDAFANNVELQRENINECVALTERCDERIGTTDGNSCAKYSCSRYNVALRSVKFTIPFPVIRK